jgi:AcrR family transcriptional regulator
MNTKDKIIIAAKDIFHQKGYDGARMQEIADASGINKALLHYHFQSKEKLFHAVLIGAVSQMFPTIMTLLNADKPLDEKIRNVVDVYIDFISKNPRLPIFVLQELNSNPEFIFEKLQAMNQKPVVFLSQIDEAVANNTIKPTKPFHLIADILGLCIFPFIAKPMLQFMSGMNDADFKQFITERKAHVTDMILNGLQLERTKN